MCVCVLLYCFLGIAVFVGYVWCDVIGHGGCVGVAVVTVNGDAVCVDSVVIVMRDV